MANKATDPFGLATETEGGPAVTKATEQAAKLLYAAVSKNHSGDIPTAERNYRKILAIIPDTATNPRERHIRADAAHLLGIIEASKGKYGTALDLMAEARITNPLVPHYHTNLANVLLKLGLPERAEEEARIAVAIAPGLPYCRYTLGSVLCNRDKVAEAREEWLKTLEITPHDVQTLVNIGTTYHYERDLDTANAYYQRAAAIDKSVPEPPYNMGVVKHDQARYAEAIPFYDQALAIRPDHVLSHWNRALTRMAMGDYEGGLEDYEWRWKFSETMVEVSYPGRRFARPFWNGESDKLVHLHGEQGFGDVIQYVRYVPMVRDLGNKVVLEVQSGLVELMRDSFPGVKVIPFARDWPGALGIEDFEMHCPLMSLPRVFKTRVETIPAPIPYLKANPKKVDEWRKKLADLPPGPRVGLCWGSGVREKADPAIKRVGLRKSMSLEVFRPIAEIPGIVPVSVQIGPWRDEIKKLGVKIHDFTDDIDNFSDTAALIENLDMIVSVDTAVVHLAGALGKKVALLELHDGCWRWLTNVDYSPWYPTVRIFRQPVMDNWPMTVEMVATALKEEIARGQLAPRPRTSH